MTPYVSTRPEEFWLDFFWTATDEHVDRIELLRKLAHVEIAKPSRWSYVAMRVTAYGITFTMPRQMCFGCLNADRRLYWHHIIQVQHGGSNTSRNLVSLCHRCHRSVHPWLEKRGTTEVVRGWTGISDYAKRALKRATQLPAQTETK